MSATIQIAGLQNYFDAFTELERRTSAQPAWLRTLREKAFARFGETGFPTTKDEDWRFTNISSVAQTMFQTAKTTTVHPQTIESFLLPGAAAHLVFVNGRYSAQLSSRDRLPTGVEAGSLAEKLQHQPDVIEAHLGRYLNTDRDAFCALNSAFLEDGAYVHVARSTVAEAPVQALFVSTGTGPQMVFPRTLIVVEAHAQAAVVEEHVSLEEGTVFSNAATELVAEENASVSHLMLERENRQALHFSTLRIQQAQHANVRSHSVLAGGALVRNNVHPVLAGEGGECLINGLFLGDDSQHLDNYMLVEHASPHCASHQFYNGILGGKSHGVFHGRILVHKDAQKTDAKQTNRNLLLTDDARIDTKPQLEIYADDVKCTHGATIGQIEENSLFYLRSRGLDEKTAREMLLMAFAGECLVRITEPAARTYVERIAMAALADMQPGNETAQRI